MPKRKFNINNPNIEIPDNYKFICATDGSAKNNGPIEERYCGYGATIRDKDDVIANIYGKVPTHDITTGKTFCTPSNNRGELYAVLSILEYINETDIDYDDNTNDKVVVIIDCQIYLGILNNIKKRNISKNQNPDILKRIKEEIMKSEYNFKFIKITAHWFDTEPKKQLIYKYCDEINILAYQMNDKADELSRIGSQLDHYDKIIG